ncbi:MAG: Gfo/Idh/MocA family oxidoreductase [Elainellaceae cyanobacterium]
MGDRTTGIAILGAGRWGSHLVRNFAQMSACRIVAIADPHRDCLQSVAHRCGLSADVLLTENWQEAIAAAGVEAVAIATPASTHTVLVDAALARGLHVLVEKPLTLNPQEAENLCALAESKQLYLLVDHTYLFHPAVAAGKIALQSPGLGHLRYGYATRTHLGPVRSDVDALWDLAIHDIAIFNHWLGDRPSFAQATGTAWLQSDTIDPLMGSNGLADVVWATLTYANGFRATLHLCWLNPDKQRRLCLVGQTGTLVFDEMQSQPLTLVKGQVRQEGAVFQPEAQEHMEIQVEPREPLNQVCAHFLTHIHSKSRPFISTGRVGLELIAILTALTASVEQGGQTIQIHYS